MNMPSKRAGAPPEQPLRAALLAQRPYYAQAARQSFVIGMLMLVPSWFMFEVYGRVLDSRNHATLYWLLLAAVVAYIILELMELARSRVLRAASERFDEQMRERVFGTAFEASLRKVPGGTVQPFNDLRTVREFIPSVPVTAALDIPAALVCLLLLYVISPWLGVLATAAGLMQAGLGWITERRTMPVLSEATVASIEAQNYAHGAMRNAQVIESMGMLRRIHERYMSRQKRFIARQAVASDTAGVTSTFAKLIQSTQSSLLLGGACWLALHDNLVGGAGMMIVASILGGRALTPAVQLVSQWRSVVTARDAYQRLEQLLGRVEPATSGMALPAPKGVLTVEAVVATAPGSAANILKGVSFAALPGEVTVIVGPSASGKTTLARLVMGLWPTTVGKVRLDGADVHGWHKSQLGEHLGYLPQGVELFDGTVAENIARFGSVDRDRVKDAADRVGVTEAIEQLPEGFDTRIGDEGAMLSGGQRQRVALARAIYGNPRLIVLDEPNSSLDEAGEKALLELLYDMKRRGATVLAISHRTTLLPAADKVLVLNEGQVALFGPRDEVLAALKKANEQARTQMEAQRKGAPAATVSPGRPA